LLIVCAPAIAVTAGVFIATVAACGGSTALVAAGTEGVTGAARLFAGVRIIDGRLTGFINLSKQDCSLTLPLGGYPNLAANDCATRRSAFGSGRAR